MRQLALRLPNPMFFGWESDPGLSVRNDTYVLDGTAGEREKREGARCQTPPRPDLSFIKINTGNFRMTALPPNRALLRGDLHSLHGDRRASGLITCCGGEIWGKMGSTCGTFVGFEKTSLKSQVACSSTHYIHLSILLYQINGGPPPSYF